MSPCAFEGMVRQMPAHHRTSKTARTPIDDLRGATRLAVEATRGVTDLVEAMHHNIAGGPSILGRPLEGPTRLLTGTVYGSIRGVTRLVGCRSGGVPVVGSPSNPRHRHL
jgi:hypothetical protein